MPELPEVETVCWRLREGGHGEAPLVGRHIEAVAVTDPTVVVDDAARFATTLVGATVRDVWRRAKWIIIDVEGRDRATHHVMVHLKMTGDLHVRSPTTATRFTRWSWRLDDGSLLVFSDPRRFGHVEVVPTRQALEARFADTGPEPLADDFTARSLRARLIGRRPIKAALLDQSVVAGVGNIYADESLWLARLHPLTPVDALSDDDVVRLHNALRRALRESVASSKNELAWRYENRAAASPFRVYDREGEPCQRCGATLSSLKVAGRTSVICPQCQDNVVNDAPRSARRSSRSGR
jgi:formamidopyrimidine-DNA glycosylase